MTVLGLQITPHDPMFWIMVIIGAAFIIIAIALIAIAVFVSRAVQTASRLEHLMEPLVKQANEISEQGKQIAVQTKFISEQIHAASTHLASASLYLSESMSLVRNEVAALTDLVSDTAIEARDKVELVSRTIDRTNRQINMTTDFIQVRVIEPARELAAIMAGFRRGLEVLVAPVPKPINETYGEDEMFIG